MTGSRFEAAQLEMIDALVSHFKNNWPVFETFQTQLRGVVENTRLAPYIHSLKSRIKNPEHLRDKLIRRLAKATEERPFDITTDNLFEKINDLVGVRILHLHTRQIADIHQILLELFEETSLSVLEVSARTWDLESKGFFKGIGIQTQDSASLYTSVHYIIDPQARRTNRTGEIQVRTLAEEIWGEVDHTLNYPHRSESVSCREQLMALARLTSGCSRLVDSIFATHADESQRRGVAPVPQEQALVDATPAPNAAPARREKYGI